MDVHQLEEKVYSLLDAADPETVVRLVSDAISEGSHPIRRSARERMIADVLKALATSLSYEGDADLKELSAAARRFLLAVAPPEVGREHMILTSKDFGRALCREVRALQPLFPKRNEIDLPRVASTLAEWMLSERASFDIVFARCALPPGWRAEDTASQKRTLEAMISASTDLRDIGMGRKAHLIAIEVLSALGMSRKMASNVVREGKNEGKGGGVPD